MASSIVGLDIGTDAIRAVELSRGGKGRRTVLGHSSVALPDGAVRSGEVIEQNTVTAALRQLWALGKFKSKDVVIGVGNPKVLVREISVPKLSLKEIRASLPAHVQDMLPVPVADALLDFYPTSDVVGEGPPAVQGLLVAAIKSSVLSNVVAVQKAGLRPVGVDLIPFALTRMASMSGNLAFVDVGARTTNVIVTADGVPQFVRIIPTGGHDVTTALTGRLQYTEEQAAQAKYALGLGGAGASQEHQPTIQVIREVTGELLNSLRNTLAYFSNVRQHEAFAGIVLSGGGANLSGFADALGEITRIPISIVDPFSVVNIPSKMQGLAPLERMQLTVALGLAIGSAE